jgi:hypothetical protein
VLLDLLATFQDENVPLPESRRLLEACLRQVERLCSLGPVLASLNPSAASAERLCLLERVCARAQFLHVLELPPPPTPQPALF